MTTREYSRGQVTRPPTHPGGLLSITLQSIDGMSVVKAAKELHISRQSLHRILAGQQPVTPEMALRLGKFFGNGPEIWLNMQRNYDVWHAQKDMKEELAKIRSYA